MKKATNIVLTLSTTLLFFNTGIHHYTLLANDTSIDDVNILTNYPMPTAQEIVRQLQVPLESSFFTSFMHIHPADFHALRLYMCKEHITSDSPLLAFKYALGQFTSDY